MDQEALASSWSWASKLLLGHGAEEATFAIQPSCFLEFSAPDPMMSDMDHFMEFGGEVLPAMTPGEYAVEATKLLEALEWISRGRDPMATETEASTTTASMMEATPEEQNRAITDKFNKLAVV